MSFEISSQWRQPIKTAVELRTTPEKGEGIFAIEPITAGDTIMVGVIKEELNENHSHASQIGENKYVFHEGLISKVNHSCDPVSGISVNSTGAHDFVAMKDISTDQEVTFDYAMRNLGIDHFPKTCMCGSAKCRGSVTGWRDLPEARKNDYKGFVAPYLLELDAKLSSLTS